MLSLRAVAPPPQPGPRQPARDGEVSDCNDLDRQVGKVSVAFDFDQSEIHESDKALLRGLFAALGLFPRCHLVLLGHSDELGPPEYNMWTLWGCFSRAQSVITSLLDEITAGPEYVFALNYDGTYFSSDLPPAIFEGRNRFYLMVQTARMPRQY